MMQTKYIYSCYQNTYVDYPNFVSGTSIAAINAAVLVSYVKENRTWEGSGQRLIDFWEYLSTRSYVEDVDPYFTYCWDFWHGLENRLHQESLQEDISALRNLFSKKFVMYSVATLDILSEGLGLTMVY
jgi:NTE family protein